MPDPQPLSDAEFDRAIQSFWILLDTTSPDRVLEYQQIKSVVVDARYHRQRVRDLEARLRDAVAVVTEVHTQLTDGGFTYTDAEHWEERLSAALQRLRGGAVESKT